MTLRIYLCPIIGDGLTPETAFRPKLDGLAEYSVRIPHQANGTPRRNWTICIASNPVWTLLDVDSTLERLFGIDLPDAIDTRAELRAFLQSKVVGDIPPARRRALNDRLTAKGMDTSGITLQTTWLQVLRAIILFITDNEDDKLL